MKKSRIHDRQPRGGAGLTTACVTDPNTGERKVSRTASTARALDGRWAFWAASSAVKTGVSSAQVSAASPAAVVGKRYDEQIKELDEQTAGAGVDVSETDGGEAILVNLPDGVTFARGSIDHQSRLSATLDRVAPA